MLLSFVLRGVIHMPNEFKVTILDGPNAKILSSPNYNFVFNKKTGLFMRWGVNKAHDPEYSPYGPEILDCEISTVCSRGCEFCYKGNTANGKNMSFYTYKKILDKMPKTLTQVAFGIGDIDANPDLEDIFKYTRSKGIVPNITINGRGMTPEKYDMLAEYCGAVAVSLYDEDECYSTVFQLASRGMRQVNIHCLMSAETYERCMKVISDANEDPRLVGSLNAIVFLHVKNKGRALKNGFNNPTPDQFKAIVNSALESGIGFGFDSCSASKAAAVLPSEYYEMIEPCESTLFSSYINVDGLAFPCSFAEGTDYKGVNVIEHPDFWNSMDYKNFRQRCLSCGRKCPIYNLGD